MNYVNLVISRRSYDLVWWYNNTIIWWCESSLNWESSRDCEHKISMRISKRISKRISHKISNWISKAISKKKEDLEGVRCCPRNPPPITNRYTIRPYGGSVKCLGGSQRSVVLMGNISGPYGKISPAPWQKDARVVGCSLRSQGSRAFTQESKRIWPIYIRTREYYVRYLPIYIRIKIIS